MIFSVLCTTLLLLLLRRVQCIRYSDMLRCPQNLSIAVPPHPVLCVKPTYLRRPVFRLPGYVRIRKGGRSTDGLPEPKHGPAEPSLLVLEGTLDRVVVAARAGADVDRQEMLQRRMGLAKIGPPEQAQHLLLPSRRRRRLSLGFGRSVWRVGRGRGDDDDGVVEGGIEAVRVRQAVVAAAAAHAEHHVAQVVHGLARHDHLDALVPQWGQGLAELVVPCCVCSPEERHLHDRDIEGVPVRVKGFGLRCRQTSVAHSLIIQARPLPLASLWPS